MKDRSKVIPVAVITALCFVALAAETFAAPFAYITNKDDDTVSVIDIATNTVVATIDVGNGPQAAVVSPDGEKVYVANRQEMTAGISVIDTATNTLTVSIGSFYPVFIAISPDGTKLYISTESWKKSNDHHILNVYDIVNNTTTKVELINMYNQYIIENGKSRGVAVSPDGSTAYVAVAGRDVVNVIETATNTVSGMIGVGNWPWGVAVSPDGTRLYVTNHDDNNVTVIDTVTNSNLLSINVGSGPLGIAVSPDGTTAYVANKKNDTVSVIDTASNTVTDTVSVGDAPKGLSVSPTGTRVYVTCAGNDIVSVIDTATNTVINNVLVGNNPVTVGNFITPEAVMAATPDFHDFGSLAAGSTSSRTFTVKNVGTASLTIGTVAMGGTDKTEFQVSSNTCTYGTVLGSLDTCTINAEFAPGSGGSKTASIRVAYTAAEAGAYNIDLAGTGVGPTITVIDPIVPTGDYTVNFSGVKANTNSDEVITIVNDGNQSLVIGAIASSDTLSAPFSLVAASDGCSSTTLTTSQSCTFTVRFSPTTSGTVPPDTFDIPSNALGTISFTLQGFAITGDSVDLRVWDEISPINDYLLPIGDVNLGVTSWPVYIRTSNKGIYSPPETNLTIESVLITGDNAAEFSIVFVEDTSWPGFCGPSTPFPVKPAYCNMYVTLTPQSPGEKTATVEIVSNDPYDGAKYYTLTGRGVGPDIEVSDSIDPMDDLAAAIGNVTVGESATVEIEVGNSGTDDLTMNDMMLTGDADFSLDLEGGLTPCGIAYPVLGANHDCTVAVILNSTSEGAKSATLSIFSNDPDEGTVGILLSGTGVAPVINNAPSAPVLVTPKDGSTVAATGIVFGWNAATDPDGDTVEYDLYVCEDSAFTGCATPENTTPLTASLKGVTYAGAGTGMLLIGIALAGGTSRRRKLALVLAALLMAGTLLAACGGGGKSTVQTGDMTFTADDMTAGTTYFWKVEATDGTDTTPSGTWSFNTK
jgi:YVTN family beta-propeller protein